MDSKILKLICRSLGHGTKVKVFRPLAPILLSSTYRGSVPRFTKTWFWPFSASRWETSEASSLISSVSRDLVPIVGRDTNPEDSVNWSGSFNPKVFSFEMFWIPLSFLHVITWYKMYVDLELLRIIQDQSEQCQILIISAKNNKVFYAFLSSTSQKNSYFASLNSWGRESWGRNWNCRKCSGRLKISSSFDGFLSCSQSHDW